MNKNEIIDFLKSYDIDYKFFDKEKYLFVFKNGVSRKIPYWEFENTDVNFKTIICEYLLNIAKLESKND